MQTINFVSGLDEEVMEAHSIKRDRNNYYTVPDSEVIRLKETKPSVMKDANKVSYGLKNRFTGIISPKSFQTLCDAELHIKGALDEHDWQITPFETPFF